jgi:hypothetical protein
MLSRTIEAFAIAAVVAAAAWGTASAEEFCHRGVPHINLEEGHFSPPATLGPDAQTLHTDGRLKEQRWHHLSGGRRPVMLICRYANKSVSFELPDAIDTCVMDYDERRVRCF